MKKTQIKKQIDKRYPFFIDFNRLLIDNYNKYRDDISLQRI